MFNSIYPVMENILLNFIKDNLINIIKKNNLESPILSYRTKCTLQIKAHEAYITKFKVLFSKMKGKIKDLMKPEEKVKITKNNFSCTGTIISIENDEICLELYKKIEMNEYDLTRVINYNNNILLEKLNNIKENKISSFVIHGFSNFLKLFCNISYNEIINLKESQTSVLNKKIKEQKKIGQFDFKNNIDTKNFSFFDKSLNANQKNAVFNINLCKPFKIIGPPGTGKTRTIIEIIRQLLNKKFTILVCGPSNVSVDNIIERFVKLNLEILFYRLGSSQKGLMKFNLNNIVEQKTSFVIKEKNERNFIKNLSKLKTKYKKDLQSETKIVFSTLFSSLSENRNFDWIIIDEACQASDAEIFLNLYKAKYFIMIGDPNQLCQGEVSFFEKIYLDTFLLNIQYRMSADLIKFSSITFYKNTILSSLLTKSICIFVDTDGYDLDESWNEKSKFNEGEANLIIEMVNLINNRIYHKIGIITPYSAQSTYLKSKIDANIEIMTVDGFQGREKDYIIVSFVRSNDEGDYGFLDDYKRLNVAITRCKKGLFLVGNSFNFRKSSLFNKFFKHIRENFDVIDPSEINQYFKVIDIV